MKRSFVISDWFYRFSHSLRRNKFAVLLYALLCLLFTVVGIAVGANISEKTEYVLRNSGAIFKFLRGESGIFAYFFLELLLSAVYCGFASSVFFNRATTFLSLAPSAYRSYVLGMNVSVIIAVFSVSAVPMLLVVYIPACIVDIVVLCMLSYRCFAFATLNRCGMPSKPDLKEYYKCVVSYFFVPAAVLIIKAIALSLFGSALIGIV